MNRYNSLFDKAEVEYITPFLKLWMAFNNWYKHDLPDIKLDREAINEYKRSGEIKETFKRFLSSKAQTHKPFQEALANFVAGSYESHGLGKRVRWARDTEYLHENPSKKEKEDSELEYIAETNQEYFLSPGEKDDFFADTLENIYQVRCALVHGDFDIENAYFLHLIENAYQILYAVMEHILNSQPSTLARRRRRRSR